MKLHPQKKKKKKKNLFQGGAKRGVLRKRFYSNSIYFKGF